MNIQDAGSVGNSPGAAPPFSGLHWLIPPVTLLGGEDNARAHGNVVGGGLPGEAVPEALLRIAE